MVFIKDFIESRHHSLFDLGQLKVYILTCRLCPQVKMLFMSRFTSQLIGPPSPQVYYSPALGFNSILPLPSGSKGGAGGGTARRGKKDEVWEVHTPVESKRPEHFQACIKGSCGTTVIKTWMRRRGRGLQSISYRSLGPSLLIDWSPGAAAPFCKVHYIITLQKNNTFDKHKIIRTLIQPQATNGLWREHTEEKKHSKMFEYILSE